MRRRKRMMAELERDIREHIERETQDNIERGMAPEEARRAARLKFGNVALVKEDTRAVWSVVWLEQVWQDVRYGLRMLRKAPGFAIIAILILALGIGANTAIFSLVDGVMLRSLPVRDPQRLVLLSWRARSWPEGEYSSFRDCTNGKNGSTPAIGCSFPLPVVDRIREQARVFSGLAAFAGPASLALTGHGLARTVKGELVSGDYFPTLGVNAVLGRTLDRGDDLDSAAPVVVLSYAFWQSALGGNRSVIGETIFLNKVPFTIVGVAEPSFTNLSPGKIQDLWLPVAMLPRLDIDWGHHINGMENWWLVVLGRLKRGISLKQAAAATSVVFGNELVHGGGVDARRMAGARILLVPAQVGLTGQRGEYTQELYIFLFAAGMILLIACANVAGLLVARGEARQKEMAVRLAIGAGRGRIVRQLLTESVLLSIPGGVVGAAVAYWGVRAVTPLLVQSSHGRFPFVVAPDWRVLSFLLGVSVLSGIFFGLAPALGSTRLDLTPALKESASTRRGGVPRLRRFPLGKSLVVAQVALSAVVLVGAGLLVRTLEDFRKMNPGFDPHNVLLFGLTTGSAPVSPTKLERLYPRLRERLAALPGVTSASYSSQALVSGVRWLESVVFPGEPRRSGVHVDVLAVGPDFLRTMHIPLLEGRGFTPEDYSSATMIAGRFTDAGKVSSLPVLVNQAFVRQYLAHENPLGAWMTRGGYSSAEGGINASIPGFRKWRVVGVVGDTKYDNLQRAIHPGVYVPFTKGSAKFELRTAGDPIALASTVRAIVPKMDANLSVDHARTQTEQIELILWQQRMFARLSSLFAVLALLLACIGMYGLLSYEVTRRGRDIGIRMALGAQRGDVLRMFLRQGIALVLMGVLAGIAISLGVMRSLAGLLYGVKPFDPLTFAGVGVVLTGVALLACWVPARRAMRVDPVVALRNE